MGTDNLFHRRKGKNAGDLARRKDRRAPYAKVLIVCEGEKTEPYYFNGLKDHYGLNSANVEVSGDCGSAPSSIYSYAKQRYREERDAGDPFDRVYCVFDKDTHTTYQQAVDDIARSTPKSTFLAITSVPCFEYWLLLHFTYTTKPYAALPGNSAGHQVLTELTGYMPGYAKGDGDTFSALIDQLDFAKSNAAHTLLTATANHTDNPTTRVHKLVEFLQKIKS
ncbi:MAG: RloB family protein [Sedimenticola sp.]